MFALMNILKPAGISSYDVIRRVRRLLEEAPPALRGSVPARRIKLGHAGTLDVLADGVLIVCLGPAVRLAELIQSYEKEYRVLACLGATTATDDAEAPPVPTPGAAAPPASAVEQALGRLVGRIRQVPPAYSAVHVAGKRAYKLARRGQEVELAPRTVVIHSLSVVSYEYPLLELAVRCGRGTYIRALVRDLGAALGVGAYCRRLTRTRVGPFGIEQAVELAKLSGQSLPDALVPPLAAIPPEGRVRVSPAEARELLLGRPIRATVAPGPGAAAEVLAALGPADRLVALVKRDAPAGVLRPSKVFPVTDSPGA